MTDTGTNNDSGLANQLVEKIITGNHNAFEILFKTYSQKLIYFSRRYVRDKQIAENIIQDVFLTIWQNKKNLDPTKNIQSYLFTAVKNESLKQLRHLNVENQQRENVSRLSIVELTPDETIDQKELREELNKAINDLPDKCREIFAMSRFDQLKYSEIADILGISVKTVETQMGRALKKLREQLAHLILIILVILNLLK
ncbi:MAG: RNA polymerase sigma-70 factor [Ignavibacteriaceae bacterium]|nr:RNA polymerase sigma-70 factor [Ignavibacteriaceae bacterium]